jgi:hypothetical protein
MGELADRTKEFFVSDDWKFSELGDGVLRLGFSGRNGNWTCIARPREDRGILLFYSIAAVNVPEEKRLMVAEYLTRANYGLPLGNFEMDFSDGEVRFKTSLDVEGEEYMLTPAMIKSLVYSNVLTMDRYLAGMMAVIYGDASPEQEIAKAEA